ncbi:hypothetical protein SAMN06265370_1306 [Puniceibacterium sediminis]|uniref:Uncharacterized protein n=1 Tax=Puniceibacterium sediminis TaxID=1608407 RepID=A0A238ZG37_9RHOB|nr:hypothetical protein SAMN06265370_1306 [Puniceibacterium sediminis]
MSRLKFTALGAFLLFLLPVLGATVSPISQTPSISVTAD